MTDRLTDTAARNILMDDGHLGKSWISSGNPGMVTPFTQPGSRTVSRMSSRSKISRRSSRSNLPKVFGAERLAFSDGSVIFGGLLCPMGKTAGLGVRPISPTGHRYAAAGSVHKSPHDAELVQATNDIDIFEMLHPTIDYANDEEEVAIKAEKHRRAALRKLVPLLDTNMDGFIDRSEMKRAMPKAADDELTKVMQDCDLDGDGKVEAEEWIEYVLREQVRPCVV